MFHTYVEGNDCTNCELSLTKLHKNVLEFFYTELMVFVHILGRETGFLELGRGEMEQKELSECAGLSTRLAGT